MSEGKNGSSSQNGETGLLKGLILLALPVLRFQQAILPNIRSGLEKDKDDIVRAIEHFIAFELHALMMLLDPAGKLRDRIDENEVKNRLKPVLDNVAAGTISFVKAQEDVTKGLISILDGMRNAEQTSGKKTRAS
ncbi:hypothetical protein [Pseudorhodoplanes sp.]|jgi:hypothetical protein|uniref:hypothetical protein n=1 Tax=Pseudorhodoplanes sp. TaxID=1934341 RepID=UPI002B58FFD0|nr:hypothetical protein [Pseudorhodoplanes sp.]HWV43202.1 hypothetical protein [Pseudorhodoplanes sp.]